MKSDIRNPQRTQGGLILLEALVAVLILAFGLLGMVGLQSRAVAALSDATLRSDSTIATEKLIGILWADQANLANYAWDGTGSPPSGLTDWVTETKALIPNATFAITVTAPGAGTSRTQVQSTINWSRPDTTRAGQSLSHSNSVIFYFAPPT